MTCGIYTRKSTATEGRSKSREEQLEVCHIDAARFGFARVLEFTEAEGQKGEWWWADRDCRNPSPHRQELGRLVQAIESGEIQAVLVYKLNRLARDNGVQDALSKLCRRFGVRLIVSGRDMEIDTARGNFNTAQEAARAREVRDQIEEDIERDLDYKFQLGQFTRNPSCYGFRSKGKGSQAVEMIQEELANVRKIYDWFLGVGCRPMGVHQVAQRCMREGIRVAVGAKGHKVRHPDRVRSSQVRSILGNCMYKGYWQHNGERKPYPQLLVPAPNNIGEPQPVVSVDTWQAAESKLAERKRCGNKAGSSHRLLTGLVVCGVCGLPCHTQVPRDKPERWLCPRRHGIERSCWGDGYSSVLVEPLDQWIAEYAAPMIAIEIEDMLMESVGAPLRRELEELAAKLEEVRRLETDRLKSALGSLDADQFADLAASIRQDRQTLERRIGELRLMVADEGWRITADPRQLLVEDPKRLQDALHRCIHWIALTRKGVVVFSKLNHLLGGRYVVPYWDFSTHRKPKSIAPPDLKSCDESPIWFADPAAFIAGRRYALGESAARYSDEELLPAFEPAFGIEDADPTVRKKIRKSLCDS